MTLIEFCRAYPDHRIGFTPGKGNGAYAYSPSTYARLRIHGNQYNSIIKDSRFKTVCIGGHNYLRFAGDAV
jgi:hypothetical protein